MRKQTKNFTEIGQAYNRLTVIGESFIKGVGVKNKKIRHIKCQCVCGSIGDFYQVAVVKGGTKSCGCLHSERAAENILKHQPKSVIKNITHGKSKTHLYNLWGKIKGRCENSNDPRFHCYGGKGVKLCDEWQDFSKFETWSLANGYVRGLSIDRINSDGIYEPSNCRWITISENSRKARTEAREKLENLTKENEFLKSEVKRLNQIIKSVTDK